MATSEAAEALSWPPRRARRNAPRLVAAIALHLLLLWALRLALDRVDLERPVREVWTSLVAVAPAPAPAARPAAPRAAPRPEPARPIVHMPLHEPHAPEAATRPRIHEPQAITLAPLVAASATAVAAVPPASVPSAPIGSILDTAATRAAIREIARVPLLSERTAAATGLALAPGANERLSQGVDAAHHGDCLHGGYTGAGMGLFSLPFLAAAAATGQCAK